MLALLNGRRLIIENVEPASGKPRRDISAGKSDMRIGFKSGIGQNVWRVVVGINRVHRENHCVIRRERRGDNFVGAHKSAGDAAIESVNKAGGISLVGAAENRGLFHRAANFSAARKFSDVVHAASEFMFGTGASDRNKGDTCKKKKKA